VAIGMDVDGNIPVRPEHLTCCGDPGEDVVDLYSCSEPPHRTGCVHLDGRQPDVELSLDRLGDASRGVATDPSIHPDAIPDRASEKLVHWDAQRLALDVPQRLVDAGDRTAQDRASAVEASLGEHLPVVLDAGRVGPQKVLPELVDRRHAQRSNGLRGWPRPSRRPLRLSRSERTATGVVPGRSQPC
jgi:hypothetical protein